MEKIETLNTDRCKRETSETAVLETRLDKKWLQTSKMAVTGGVGFEGCIWAVREDESIESNSRILPADNRNPLWNEKRKTSRQHAPSPTPRPAHSHVPLLAPNQLSLSIFSISVEPPRREE